jgi:hypothetical protein
MISELSCEFPQISCTVLYEIITVKLGYHKFCARCIPEILMGVHKCRESLWRYHKDGDEPLNHVIQVTDDETWASFMNVESKEHSKQ